MKLMSWGCACLVLLCALVLAMPFMMAVGNDSPASAAGISVGTRPVALGQSRELPWRQLFDWTPPGSDANAWPWGQCTWFVVGEGHAGGDHRVHWSGDAWQWYGNAQAAGYPTLPASATPQVGWIVVYARGHGADAAAGHVAVVVAVTSTTYTIAEAHVLGLGVIDERTLSLPSVGGSQPIVEGWIP